MALTLGSAAYGQSRLIADIPFSFRINGTEIPASTYSVERMQNSASNVVLLTDGHNHKMAMGISDHYGEQNAPRLIFSCREGKACMLAQVWDTQARSEIRHAKANLGREGAAGRGVLPAI